MAEKKSVSESDTIILSLHERWWKKMLAGEKILEIRKTAPVQKDREYRVLVYVTGGGSSANLQKRRAGSRCIKA